MERRKSFVSVRLVSRFGTRYYTKQVPALIFGQWAVHYAPVRRSGRRYEPSVSITHVATGCGMTGSDLFNGMTLLQACRIVTMPEVIAFDWDWHVAQLSEVGFTYSEPSRYNRESMKKLGDESGATAITLMIGNWVRENVRGVTK